MLRRTSIVWLIVLAMVGLGAGWTLVLTVDAVAGRILGVPLMASIALWVLALGIVMWAVLSRSRLPGAAQSGSDSIRIRTDDVTAAAHQAANRMPPIIAARKERLQDRVCLCLEHREARIARLRTIVDSRHEFAA